MERIWPQFKLYVKIELTVNTKKKAYGDISIKPMCLRHLHIYAPSTDNVVSFYTQNRGHFQ